VIAAHFPALQIVIPLIAAPLCILLRWRDAPFGIALVATWSAFIISSALLGQVMDQGVIVYEMGGWAAPWGIEYRIDAANAMVLLIVSGIGSVVVPYTRNSMLLEYIHDRHYMFYSAYLLCLTGLMGVAITGDAFNLFVFLEISSLSSYVLISLGFDRRALTAAYQYLVLGTIGATFIVIGIGLLYHATGTLNMMDMSQKLAANGYNRTVVAAFAFITVGTMLKLALFPLHLWLPDAYTYAPSSVSAFLAATATKVAVYVLLRFFFTIFGAEFSFETLPSGPPLMALAIIAMFTGSFVAIFQENVKRMLAYSSVAQIGYMILGVSLVTIDGLTATVLHLFNHALIKGSLFLVMGCIYYRIASVHIDDFAGLGRRLPLTMAAFVIGGLSLIGVPLTAGFISKWQLVLAALDRDLWWVAALIMASSLLAVVYVWRVVEIAYFRPQPPGKEAVTDAPVSLLIPTWVLIILNIYFGIHAELPMTVARMAAHALLGAP
jgi:multicomponent Na+:H+ antiporter subunit D